MAEPAVKKAFRSIDVRECENNLTHAMIAFNRGDTKEAEGRLKHVLGKLAARGLQVPWEKVW